MEGTPGTGTQAGAARKKSGRGFFWALFGMAVAFGGGYVWQYMEAAEIRDRLTDVEQELAVERFSNRLGQATMSAQAGDFEAARVQMSGLFNTLQADAGTLPPEIQDVANDFLARRDDIITGLSRSNPAFADVLYGMLERLGSVAQRSEPAEAPPPAAVERPEPTMPGPAEETPEPGTGTEAEAADTTAPEAGTP